MQTRLKSKRIQAIIALAIAALLVLSGTFAWYTFSQNRINTFEVSATAPNVNLHDDFAGGPEKDVYVENSGDFNVLVRVRLSELIKRGNDLTPENAVDDDDAFGWHVHAPSADGCDICEFEAHKYFDWTMNGQKFYMPAHNSAKGSDSVEPLAIGDKEAVIDYAALLKDAFTELYASDQAKLDTVLALMDAYLGGETTAAAELMAEIAEIPDTYTISVKQYAEQPESEHLRKLNEVRLTLVPSQIITMQDWINGTTYGTPLFAGDFWVMDSDGWCYWANALAPNAATGQLLSAVNYKNNYSNGEFTYKINVNLNATSLDGTSLATFFLVAEQNGGVSDDAMILMFLASGEYIFGEDGEIYHNEGGGFYRKINKNNGRYVNYTLGETVYAQPGTLPGGSGGMSVGGQFDIDDEGNITDGGGYQIEDIAIGDNGVPYYDVGGGVYLAPVDENGNPDNSGEKYAIVHTGTDGQTGNDDDIGPVRAEGNFPQWYFVDIQEVTDGDVIEAGQKGSLIRADNETEIPLQTFSVQQSVYRVQSITRGENGLLYLKLDEDLYAVAFNAYADPVNLTMSEVWGTDAESGEPETVPVPSTYYIIYPAESGKIGTENDTTDITPVISEQPVVISGIYGDTATTLSVTASGAGTRTYQWYKNGAPIAGAVSDTLEIIDAADSGDYYCTVTANVKGHSLASVNTDTVTVSITARPITITAGSASKDYDGTPLTHNSYTITSGSIASGDSLDVTYTGTRTDYGTADNEISTTTITRAGTDVAANYNVTTVNGTLSVTKRPLTITAGSASKDYDGTPLTENSYTISGTLASGETLSVIVTGSITENGTADNVISAYTITRSDTDVTANYDVTTVNGTLTIGSKTLSGVTVTVSGTYTYNGVAQTPTYTVKDGGTTLTEGTHFTAAYSNNTNAGTATITLTGTGNYSSQKTQTFTIAKAPLTITANSRTVTYRDAKPTFDVTYSGFVNSEGSNALGGLLSFNCPYTATSNVDTYDITPQGLTSSNYAITFVKGTLTVNAKALANAMLNVTNPSSYTYTGAQIKPTFTAIDGTAINAADYDVSYGANINAGTGSITITGKGNYSGQAIRTFTIARKPLTAAMLAVNGTYTYDGTAQTPTVTVTDGSVLTNGTHYNNVTGSNNTNAGTASVSVTGIGNYINTVSQNFTIAKRPITLTAGSASKEYDGTPLTNNTYTLTSGTIADGDSISSVTYSGTITDVGPIVNTISSYTIMRSGVDVTANYVVGTVNGTLNVTNPFSAGAGTSGSPFLITSKADLEKLRDKVNANTNFSTGKYFRQNANIDLIDQAWTPIGNADAYPFKGSYDGNGYKISGTNVNLSSGIYAGLFGLVQSGTVQNLFVQGNVRINVNTATTYAGGIAGAVKRNPAGDPPAAITNCVFSGTVTNANTGVNGVYAGGIVGSVFYNDTTVSNCFVAYGSEVTAVHNSTFVRSGGIAGQVMTGRLSSNYSLAKVSSGGGQSQKGGIVGEVGGASQITANAFLRSSVLNEGLNAIGIGSGTYTSVGYFSDLNSTLTATNSTSVPANLIALLSAGAEGSGKAWIQYVSGGSWPLPATIRDKTLGDYVEINYAGGKGTEAEPYQIATKTQLEYMRNQVNAGTTYEGVYFEQTANIDLGGENWTPIGSGKVFAGNYNGGGNKIGGLNFSGAGYGGLFGQFAGTVRNLYVEGSVTRVGSSAATGGIAGIAYSGAIISDCVFSGTVIGQVASGGIVGVINADAKVERCYVTYGSDVSGAYAGGVAGMVSGTLNSSYSLAKVIGGGIVSRNSGTVTNSAFMKTDALNDGINAVRDGTGITTNCGSFATVSDTIADDKNLLNLLNTDQTGTPWLQTNAGISWPVLSAINREHDGWDGTITGANIGYVKNDTLKTLTIQAPGALAYLTSELNNSDKNIAMNSFAFILANDIDLNGIPWTPIGISTSSTRFKTTFDGDGYTIKGLNVQTTTGTGSGLFGYTEGATIKNLAVKGYVSHTLLYNGGIVGALAADSYISDCVFSGNVTGLAGIGGVVGSANNSKVYRCYTAYGSEITSFSDGASYSGGVIGAIGTSAEIRSCYSLAKVTAGVNQAGGVAGQNSSGGTITNSAFLKTGTFNNGINEIGSNNGTVGNVGYFADANATLQSNYGSMPAKLLDLLQLDVGAGKWRAAVGGENNGYPVLVAIR